MTPVFPVPTLDHVVVNARDRIDHAAETYRRLGFTLTPRGYHTLGSMNHLAMFGTDYLELIAAKPGDDSRPEIMSAPFGLDGLVFGTEDAAATYEALRRAEVPIDRPQQFSRPVEAGGVARDAVFRTARLPRAATPAGRLYFCQHLTRDLVWRDEWRHHPNSAVGVARAVIAAEEPEILGGLFAQMFGPRTVRATDDGCSLILGLSRFDVVHPGALWEMFGGAAPDSRGRRDYMAALTFRTLSLDAAETALEAGGVRGVDRIGTSVLVPATEAFGVTLEFSV
jgi:Glyoxalase-like domain